ncbi:hypothetical protein [Bdellovibrio svalbardensis]|uniref:DUF5666 domain-containing protein n=1 Tax=Bdellovibrio svalbardensis TaxID=2972972 RepID=A0ABT6DEB9_9BACT|nr:hypothetical protein [Bdellovibrio svalbardensis]MDG0815182.1 hypothetical protein [Bdellovibrio svalbardensis]
MFKNILVCMSLLLVASVSQAALRGEWTGWGEWTYQGQGTHCTVMKLKFSESAEKLTRDKGYFDCGIVGLDLPAQEFIKQGDALLVDGEVVGSVQGDLYQWREQYSESVVIKNSIQVSGGHLDYKEIWYDSKGDELYVITGRMFLKE